PSLVDRRRPRHPSAPPSFPTRRSSDLIALPGGVPRRLTSDTVHEQVPTWSPDGQWIAYVTWSDRGGYVEKVRADARGGGKAQRLDRKSTRLNCSHLGISYAGFCLKKQK